MSGTISNIITVGYTLSVNPTTITQTGAVSAASGAAVYGAASTAWSVVNQGGVQAATGIGIALDGSGTLTNQAGAWIYGQLAGITIAGAGAYLANAGTIQGDLTTTSALSPAVQMTDGGTVTNTGGSIAGTSGVEITGAAGTVTNRADIDGVHGAGVSLGAGGVVTNASSGSIYGYAVGISLSAAGTVTNYGAISGGVFARGVSMAGGLLDNMAGGSIEDAARSGGVVVMGGGGLVLNAGTIEDELGVGAIGVMANPGASVTNTDSGWIAATDFGVYSAGTVSVTNFGSILATGGSDGPTGVEVGGFVSNATSAYISGVLGVSMKLATNDTLLNAGTIHGGTAGGVMIDSSGLVSNASGGMISGYGPGIEENGGATLTLVNAGRVTSTSTASFGVYLRSRGTLVNNAGGSIAGAIGVKSTAGGTITNAGTIASTGTGDAVYFAAGFANRLIVRPGAVFTGKIDGANTIGAGSTSVLELSGSFGSLGGLGGSVVNFGSIAFDVGAAGTLSGVPVGLADGQVISGFTIGDTLDLVGVSETIAGFASGTLTLTGAASLDLLLPGGFTADQFQAVPSEDGTAITVGCFAAGTRIATPGGEVAVEVLRVGDRVVSVFGGIVPVMWLGRRRVDCRRHNRPAKVWPVCVHAGAFGDGLPHRDLWLSPDHAVFVDDVLIPIRRLINGTSIEQVPMDQATYYHVELERHDVLLADGLPAESYLNTGDRCNFETRGGPIALHPEFSTRRSDTALIWEAFGCARLIVIGPELERVRRRVSSRAAVLATVGSSLGGNPSHGRSMHRRPFAKRQSAAAKRLNVQF